MPTTLTFIHTEEFIRATPDGTLDLEESRKLLTALVSAIKKTAASHALVDTRGAKPRLSRYELLQLGMAVGTQSALKAGRIALLVPLDQTEDAEFLESVARLEGANLRAFVDFEAAITWLIMSDAVSARGSSRFPPALLQMLLRDASGSEWDPTAGDEHQVARPDAHPRTGPRACIFPRETRARPPKRPGRDGTF